MSEFLAAVAANVPITVALIASTGVLIGAVISYYISRRSNYINTVTASRVNWIGNVRSNIANLYGQVEYIYQHSAMDDAYVDTDDCVTQIRELTRIATLIKLQLNPFAEIDKNMIIIVDKLIKHSIIHDDDAIDLCMKLALHAQWLFKAEWEKVNFETAEIWRKPFLASKAWRHMRRYAKFLSGNE